MKFKIPFPKRFKVRFPKAQGFRDELREVSLFSAFVGLVLFYVVYFGLRLLNFPPSLDWPLRIAGGVGGLCFVCLFFALRKDYFRKAEEIFEWVDRDSAAGLTVKEFGKKLIGGV